MKTSVPHLRSGFRAIPMLLAAGLFLSACGGSSGETGGDAPDSTGDSGEKVSITYATGGGLPPNEMQAGIFHDDVIEAAGLEHIGTDYDLDILTTKGTSEAQSLLVSGQAQIATVSFGTFATMISTESIPDGLTIIAGQYIDGAPGKVSNPFMVLEDSDIREPGDVRGKTLGINAIGSAVDVALRVWLHENGIEENEVEFAEVPFGAQGAALREGKIDTGVFVQPFIALEQSTGGVRTLFTEADALGGENAAIAIAVRNDFLNENPDAVRAFLADWVKGLQWFAAEENRDDALNIMAELSGTPPENLALFYGTEQDYFRDPNACPNPGALQVGIDGMVVAGYLDETVEVAPHTDASFLPNACS